MLNVIKLV